MSISLAATCLRMANINSCLRMVEAFSTVCFPAKLSNSTGDLDLTSWSFISRMRLILGRPAQYDGRSYEGEGSQVFGGAKRLWPNTAVGPFSGRPRKYRLRLVR